MKFKIGQKVKIRKDLVVDKYYGEDKFVEGMKKYIGKKATIVKIYTNYYYLDIDNKYYCWTDEMIEPYKTLDNLEEGDILIDKDGDEFMVLGVHKYLVHLSDINNFNTYDEYSYTISELKEANYKIKGQEDEDKETIELFGKKYNKKTIEEALKDIEEEE